MSTFTSPVRDKRYTEEDFKPFVKRHKDWDNRHVLELPNLTPLNMVEALNRISSHPGNYLHGHIKLGTHEGWGTLWMDILQGGGWTGTGIVVLANYNTRARPTCYRFALCKHELKYLPTANPSRGLHDRFCTLCGLDMSYDSSD